MDSENEELEMQEARVKLRSSFLMTVGYEFKDEACKIVTYENSILDAKFNGWKPDGVEILVSDLHTPAAVTIPSALIKTNDIVTIVFDKQLELNDN